MSESNDFAEAKQSLRLAQATRGWLRPAAAIGLAVVATTPAWLQVLNIPPDPRFLGAPVHLQQVRAERYTMLPDGCAQRG